MRGNERGNEHVPQGVTGNGIQHYSPLCLLFVVRKTNGAHVNNPLAGDNIRLPRFTQVVHPDSNKWSTRQVNIIYIYSYMYIHLHDECYAT